MIAEVTKLTNGNRVVIPAAIRKSLGLRVGDAVTLVLQNKLLLNNYNVNLRAIAMPVQGLKYDRFYFLSKINF